jgi:hypothetical protein
MHTMRLAAVVLVGIGLSACIGVNDGYHRQPYGTFAGSAHLAAPYVYPSGATPYLYNQSQGSWQRTYGRQNRRNDRNRHDRPGHDNRRSF